MRRRIITVFMYIAGIVMAAVCVWLHLQQDHVAPQIIINSVQETYHDSMDENELLKGVQAIDDLDGDLSDQVFVSDVSKIGDKDYVYITYTVMDKANNVTQKTIMLDYE